MEGWIGSISNPSRDAEYSVLLDDLFISCLGLYRRDTHIYIIWSIDWQNTTEAELRG